MEDSTPVSNAALHNSNPAIFKAKRRPAEAFAEARMSSVWVGFIF